MEKLILKHFFGPIIFFLLAILAVVYIVSDLIMDSKPVKEVEKEEPQRDLGLSNEEIIALSKPCLDAGLSFSIEKDYSRTERKSVSREVICSPLKPVETKTAGVTEAEIDTNSISVLEHVGLKLIGF